MRPRGWWGLSSDPPRRLRRWFACAGRLALALVGWAAGVPAIEDGPVQGLGEIKDVTIVVADEPYIGDLLPAPTRSEFRFWPRPATC